MSLPPIAVKHVCRACHTAIDPRATVCPHCGTHQVRWKSALLFWSSAIGIIVAGASLLVSAVASLPAALRVISWKDSVQVLAFELADGVILANDGDGEVFVSNVVIKIQAPNGSAITRSRSVERSLQPGQVLSASFRNEPRKKLGDFGHLANPLSQYTSDLLVRAMDPSDSCFDLDVFYQDDPSLNEIRAFYDQMYKVPTHTFPAQAWLNFYSAKTRQLTKAEFSVLGTLLINRSQSACERVEPPQPQLLADSQRATHSDRQAAGCEIIGGIDGSGTMHGHVVCEPCPPGEPSSTLCPGDDQCITGCEPDKLENPSKAIDGVPGP